MYDQNHKRNSNIHEKITNALNNKLAIDKIQNALNKIHNSNITDLDKKES